MNMHRVGRIPDWERIDPSEWNEWQRRAAATKGWDTPGNRETVKGGIACGLGLWAISKDIPFVGTALMGWGRWKDIQDGRKAEATGTKSPGGEILDAAMDRVVQGAAIPVLHSKGIITDFEAAALAGEGIANAASSITAKYITRREIHPSRVGKVFAFATWSGLGVLSLAHDFERVGVFANTQERLKTLGHGLLKLGLAGGAVAGVGYIMDAATGTPIEQSDPGLASNLNLQHARPDTGV